MAIIPRKQSGRLLYDDLGDLTINPERASGNYIRITGNDVTFYLNEYKTKGQYGQIN